MPSGDSTLLQVVARFELLDRQRRQQTLSAEEELEWQTLKAQLSATLHDAEGFWSTSDRRNSLRVGVDLVIYFASAGRFRRAYIKDLSDGGLFIETDRDLAIGDRMDVRIRIDAPKEEIQTRVEIVWQQDREGRGYGAKFIDLSDDAREQIFELVYAALANHAAESDESSES